MSEHLIALPVILVLAGAVFIGAIGPITAQACSPQDFRRRRNLWFVLTLAAFLTHSFWLFMVIAALALALTVKAESNRFALYFGLMLAVPPIAASVPGLGVFNELFSINLMRLLALVVLLPTYLVLRGQSGVDPFGRLWCDKLLLGYLALEVVLTLPYRTATSVLRDSVFYAFTDVFLPYYVASRSLRTLKAFRDAIAAFVVGVLVLSVMLMFEFARSRLLYVSLAPAMGVFDYGWGTYLGRAGGMRAMASIGHPIAAGYTCAVALGLYLYLQRFVPGVLARRVGALVLVGGMVGALSRAPWIGAAFIVVVFVVLGPAPTRGLMKIGLAVLLALPLLILTPAGQRFIDLLPWVGTVEAFNVEGRERLAEVSYRVFLQSPFFGRFDYTANDEMESLRGGHGIIDTVNTYVVVALRGGGVSLALFCGFFLVAGSSLFRAMRRVSDHGDEGKLLGRALFATLMGMLFMIGTVSPVLDIPTLYWSVGGLMVACVRLLEQRRAAPLVAAVPRAAPGPRRMPGTGGSFSHHGSGRK